LFDSCLTENKLFDKDLLIINRQVSFITEKQNIIFLAKILVKVYLILYK